MPSANEIGETAGTIYRFLEHQGPSSQAAIERAVEAPRTVVLLALGWLAREGKIGWQHGKRGSEVVLA